MEKQIRFHQKLQRTHSKAGSQRIRTCFFRDVDHPFLEKQSTDYITRQVFKTGFVVRPDRFPAINVEAAVAPTHHVVNHKIVDAPFGPEHLENLLAECVLKIPGPRFRPPRETVVCVKAAIRGDDMQVGIELLEFAEGVYGDCGPGDRLFGSVTVLQISG